VSQLLPDGITHLADAPYSLHDAILTGLRLLSYEELPKDERPPRDIWLDGDKLTAHFHEVERQRKEKYGIKTDADDGDYEVNEAAMGLIARG
jgi:hypothetical protein